MAPRVWLITGASSGLGLSLAEVVAKKGEHVIAASRSPEKNRHLNKKGIKVAHLNQNDSLSDIQADMESIISIYGTVDVLVNNAGYVQTGILEETSPEISARQFETNVFGVLNVCRAILPHMRGKKSGTLVTIGSMAGWMTLPACNLYGATKAAVRSIGLGLAGEVAPFGVRHMLVEPGMFRTELLNPAGDFRTSGEEHIAGYKEAADATMEHFARSHGKQPGDPVKGAEVIYDVVTSSGVAEGRELPAVLPLGSDAIDQISKSAQEAIDGCKEWREISCMSDFVEAK